MANVSPGRRFSWPGFQTLALAAAGLLWAAFFAYIALEARPPRIPGISAATTSPAGHFLVFAVATAWFYLLFKGGLRLGARSSLVAAVIASLLLGVAVEVAQNTLTESRAFQRRDIAANLSGTFVASIFIALSAIAFTPMKKLVIAVLIASVATAGGTAAVLALWDPDLPYVGDHWHAQYRTILCGEVQRSLAPFPGDIHSHGGLLIHIHPTDSESEGANATLGRFFDLAGGEITSTSIRMPDGREFRNGDPCPGGDPGEFTVHLVDTRTYQRTEKIESPATYVPKQGDSFVIEFLSEPYILSASDR